MATNVNITKLTTSWTKYDIVQVMEVIFSLETIEKFKRKEADIDEPILRSFLGIKSLSDPTPSYWIDIQNFPREKKLFALLAILFTHHEIIKDFATKYSKGNMKGTFRIESGKQYTNIRSALIESEAAAPIYRRTESVPYDLTLIFQNEQVGKLFKKVLHERIDRIVTGQLTDEIFYDTCIQNDFHKALSLDKEQFISWLEGGNITTGNYIKKIQIANFFSISDALIDFGRSREIYFLGENGDGKSLVLMALLLSFNGNYIREKTDQEQTGKASDILRNFRNTQLIGTDDKNQEYNLQNGRYLNHIFAYGTHRGRYSTDKPEEYGFMSLFDSNQTLINPVSWIKDQKLIQLEKTKNNQLELEGNGDSPISYIEQMFHELLEKNVQIKIEGSEVAFIEKGTAMSFDQLSEGYKSILIFVSDLLYRFNINNSGDITPAEFRGIVLVDEVDLHLHPKWQRAIVGKLRVLMPQVQFIFTTHSPSIIQGASEDAVLFRVFRNAETGKTQVSDPYLRKDLNHLMINSLLTSPLFGLADSRMNGDDELADTSDTYLLYRINKKLTTLLEQQKAEGKEFISDDTIDGLIDQILKDDLENHD